MALSIVIRSAPRTSSAFEAPALTFDGSRIVIGRGPGCEVRLPEPSVSHRHASVRANGSEFAIVDEGSTNGTFVGGVQLSPHTPRTLRSGDLVRVGRVWLEVQMVQGPATRDLASATRDVALALVAGAMQAMGDDIVPKVHVVEGRDAGTALALHDEGRAYLVGRGASCDLPLEDADASREHIQLVRRAGAVLVRDLGSKNVAQMGDAPIPADRDVHWRNQLMIRIGQSVIALEEPVAAALAELERGSDEPLPTEDLPPPPGEKVAPLGAEATSSPIAASDPKTASKSPVTVGPVADVAKASARSKRSRSWSGTDLVVVIAAVGVLVMSFAGLYWILHG